MNNTVRGDAAPSNHALTAFPAVVLPVALGCLLGRAGGRPLIAVALLVLATSWHIAAVMSAMPDAGLIPRPSRFHVRNGAIAIVLVAAAYLLLAAEPVALVLPVLALVGWLANATVPEVAGTVGVLGADLLEAGHLDARACLFAAPVFLMTCCSWSVRRLAERGARPTAKVTRCLSAVALLAVTSALALCGPTHPWLALLLLAAAPDAVVTVSRTLPGPLPRSVSRRLVLDVGLIASALLLVVALG